jgi:hypothetical protein
MKFWNTDTVQTKKCKTCGEVKPLDEFPTCQTKCKKGSGKIYKGYRGRCKFCHGLHLAKDKDVYIENKRLEKERQELSKIGKRRCSMCSEVKSLDDFPNDSSGRVREGKKSYCKSCGNVMTNNYRKTPTGKLMKARADKKYQKNNRKKLNKKSIERYHSDSMHKMKVNLRSRIGNAFKLKGWKKDSSTQKMLGCDWETLKIHMESQFKDGMSWDNSGDWHIDHIIPLDCARDEEEMKKLCHYTNLQPMWGPENQSKSNKVLKEHYDLHYKLLGRYYK